jgi:hypothetical protein
VSVLLTATESESERLADFVRMLADPMLIAKKLLIGTGADEDARREQRHRITDLVSRLAKAWPNELDASQLWAISEAINKLAWTMVDAMRPTERDHARGVLQWYQRGSGWNEGVLLLITAGYVALSLASERPELVPRLPAIMDQKLLTFLNTRAYGRADEVDRMLDEYVPAMHLSYLSDPVGKAYRRFKDDPRLAGWSKEWLKYFEQ